MSVGRDWMGEFVNVSPEVWAAAREGFGFHDSVFVGAEFPLYENPRLCFDAAVYDGQNHPPIRVAVELFGTVSLTIERPQDVVVDFIVAEAGGVREFQWIEGRTGLPTIRATALRIEVTLLDRMFDPRSFA